MYKFVFCYLCVIAHSLSQIRTHRGQHHKPHHHHHPKHPPPEPGAEQQPPPASQPPPEPPPAVPPDAPPDGAAPGAPPVAVAEPPTLTKDVLEAVLTPAESRNILQGGHFGSIVPEPGFYIGTVDGNQRLNLPALKMQDSGNGFRTTIDGTEGTTIAWPCSLALASTWDDVLVHEVANAMGQEFRGKGSNVMLGPAVNVHRVALNGRNFEYLSGEDPYLGSRLAFEFVQGVQEEGVMATMKHFAFNEQEGNRMLESSHVDDTTAWELYYPPFEAGVKAGAGAVMCSYNRVNGTFACHNPNLLNRDLRGGMGFKGFVVSDWGATHGIDALSAGMDVEMPGRVNDNDGIFSDKAFATLDTEVMQNATRHVRQSIVDVGIAKIGDLCAPGPECFERLRSNQISEAHLTIARNAATSAVVLLKNDDYTLPISSGRVRKVAVLGTAASFTGDTGILGANYYSGGGSGHVYGRPLETPLQGIQKRALAAGVAVLNFSDNHNVQASLDTARGADMILVFAAATSSEMEDRKSLLLDHDADLLIFRLGELNIPTVVLLQTPGAVLTPWRDLGHIKAVANVFLPGEVAGTAWASVLFGDVNPSGKLPIMFPASQDDTIKPGSNMVIQYTEGLFTSYRSKDFKAAYAFGHGLSYTVFDYGTPWVESKNCKERACVSFNLTNTGTMKGAEVAQAYLQYNMEDPIEPQRRLRGFHKVELSPQETKTVTFALKERDLSIYRDAQWIRQKDITLHIGTSSADIKKAIRLVSH